MKFKRCITPLLFVSCLLLAGWLGFQVLTYSVWESTLSGPFQGTVHQGELTTNATSVLKLSRGALLELHEVPGLKGPVLALRRDGKIEWQQAMIPVKRYQNGSQEIHSVSRAKLRKTVFALTRGTKVRFSCYWTGGGYEGGLIYLKPDQTLDHFGISW